MRAELYDFFTYYILRKRPDCPKGKKLSFDKFVMPEEFVEKLSGYDVVSFDVFDTLLFRTVEKPVDVFACVERKMACHGFAESRIRAEARARKALFQQTGCGEVNLEEIYKELEKEAGLSKSLNQLKTAELEEEKQCCYANPFFTEVVRQLKKQGRRILITSDMYLGKERIKELLEMAGFEAFDACYVSCEYRASKWEGSLYDIVRKEETGKKYIHIGDNPVSDVKKAIWHGFDAAHYKRK